MEILKSLRVHGQGADKYDNVRIGMTSRLDTVQAAVLIEKLKIFADEIAARNEVARRYAEGLNDVAVVPAVPDGLTSVWAQYTIRLKPGARDGFAAELKAQGIPTAIYYPKPLHRLEAYRQIPGGRQRHSGDRPVGRGGHQPADARLSRRRGAGSGDRGCPRRAQALNWAVIGCWLAFGNLFRVHVEIQSGRMLVRASAMLMVLTLGACSISGLLPDWTSTGGCRP